MTRGIRFVSRSKRRLTLAGVLIVIGLGSAWWLFGFTTSRLADGSRMRLYRRFGRVTRIDSDVVVKGKTIHDRLLFPWSEPFVNGDPLTSAQPFSPNPGRTETAMADGTRGCTE